MRSDSTARMRSFPARVCLCVFGAILLAGCGGEGDRAQAQQQAPAPVSVAVRTVQPAPVEVYATYPGRVRGAREVQVLARIEGILLERHYNEGQIVEQGQLLATIDPRPFLATVEQREAQLAGAEVELNQAQRVWQRVSRLYEVNAVSEAERDQALSALEAGRASVQLAEANLESARIDLSYTTVEAPLTGVTSLEDVDEGALVTQGTRLTTVTELDPVYVLFSLPAEDAMVRQQALTAMVEEDGVTRTATLILPSGAVFDGQGEVDFTQSTINPATGTVRLRAVFDNSENNLVPGRFVRVRIRLETRENAIVVPNKAISDNQQLTQVYVVADDNTAAAVRVVLGPTVAQGRIIEDGLEPGDRVITIGLGQVSAGAPVEIKPAESLALGGAPGMAGDGENAAESSAAVETPETSASQQGDSDERSMSPSPAGGQDD